MELMTWENTGTVAIIFWNIIGFLATDRAFEEAKGRVYCLGGNLIIAVVSFALFSNAPLEYVGFVSVIIVIGEVLRRLIEGKSSHQAAIEFCGNGPIITSQLIVLPVLYSLTIFVLAILVVLFAVLTSNFFN